MTCFNSFLCLIGVYGRIYLRLGFFVKDLRFNIDFSSVMSYSSILNIGLRKNERGLKLKIKQKEEILGSNAKFIL